MAFLAYDPGSFRSQTAKQLKALQKFGLPTAQAYQNISQGITPQENALAFGQYQQYAPLFSALGSQLQGQEQQAGIRNDLSSILGPGQDLVANAQALDMLVNPQWYQQRDITNQGYSQLLAGQNPNRLSGSELTETERGVNRLNTSRGNINITDATTTAANAGAFGSALAGKQARFAQALSLFPSLSGASRSPLDTFGIATGKNNQPNPFSPSNISTGTQVGQNIAQNQGQTAALNQQIRASAPTGLENVNNSFGTLAKFSSCCFIFMEHYGYASLPSCIRWVRDYEYCKNPKVARGYKKMAYWLIPLMQRNRIIRQIILWVMIKPLTKYGEYLTGYNKWGRIFKPFKSFWLTIWAL